MGKLDGLAQPMGKLDGQHRPGQGLFEPPGALAQHKKSRISVVIRCISLCTRDSFGIVPAAFRYDISKSHAAYGHLWPGYGRG